MRVLHRAGLLAAAVSTWTPAGAQPLQPAGKWVVTNAADQCTLTRDYGSPSRPLVLKFTELPLNDGLGFAVLTASNAVAKVRDSGKIGNVAGPAKPVGFFAYPTRPAGTRRITTYIKSEVRNGAATSGVLRVDFRSELRGDFSMPDFNEGLQALDRCAVALGKSWGIPIEHQQQIKEPAQGAQPVGSYFMSEDFPQAELKRQASGISRLQVSVDENGKPSNCIMRPSTGVPALDELTCRILLKRVRYKPAIDLQGRPVASFYVNEINWLAFVP